MQVCLECDAIIKSGEIRCATSASPADERDPDDIRAAYYEARRIATAGEKHPRLTPPSHCDFTAKGTRLASLSVTGKAPPACMTSNSKPRPTLTPGLRRTLAVASGVAVANIYYNQPILADIGRTFHAASRQVGLVATATQIGYAVGMPLFVPLGDFINLRTLVVTLFAAVAVALAAAAMAPSLGWMIAVSFLIGITTVIAQILIPLATDLASPEEQGSTIGAILTRVLL
jgi:hypothetical protein